MLDIKDETFKRTSMPTDGKHSAGQERETAEQQWPGFKQLFKVNPLSCKKTIKKAECEFALNVQSALRNSAIKINQRHKNTR